MIAQKLDHQEVMSKILLRKSKKKNGGSIALADIIHVVKVILSKDAQLPQIVKELLIETINSCARIDDTLLGLILKTQDADLLTFLKDKVLEDKKVVRYINILKSQGLIDYEEHVSEEE